MIFLVRGGRQLYPAGHPGLGLLTDHDREILEGYGLELAPRTEEKLSREYTIVYTTCAQPAQKLYVTWPAQGETGGEKRPSFLIERLETLFPQCQRREKPAPSPDQLRSLAAGVPVDPCGALGGPAFCGPVSPFGSGRPLAAGALVAGGCVCPLWEKVPMSASRMDQYQSCHFAYFLRYGLDARARRPAGFDAPEYGTVCALCSGACAVSHQDQGGAARVSDEAIQGFATQAVRDYVHGKLGGMGIRRPASGTSSAAWKRAFAPWWKTWWRSFAARIFSPFGSSWASDMARISPCLR
ncbi:MAG: PD-(D/E)XK nuclease family protein [Evtepia sp.]